MPKRDRILACFPAFFRARDTTKLLHEVVTGLAAPLEESEAHLFRIQRAHRILVAEDARDIVRLAGALNLDAFHFEDLQSDASLWYAVRRQLMRDRVKRIAMVHLEGLGTPWAVMESAAIFLNAEIVPERDGDPLIAHLDDRYRSHKAAIEFAASALPGTSGPTRCPRRDRIYLYEELLRRQKVDPVERWQLDSWIAEATLPDPGSVRFLIQGHGDRTVRPSIFCPSTGEGIWFNGFIPDGRTLVVDANGGARLDDEPVDDWLITFKGGIHDFSREDTAPFVREHGGAAATAFLGNLEDLTVSAVRPQTPVPSVAAGRSEWFYKVAAGIYGDGDFDLCVFDPPGDPIGIFGNFDYDACVFDYPAAAVAGMGWDESIPCAFKLLLPPQPDSAPDTPSTAPNYVSRISAVLPRFRAAGVRGIVDTAKDSWILGESVIRDESPAEENGLVRRATRLRDASADRFVALDSASTAGPSA
jgi:hypothetical protein